MTGVEPAQGWQKACEKRAQNDHWSVSHSRNFFFQFCLITLKAGLLLLLFFNHRRRNPGYKAIVVQLIGDAVNFVFQALNLGGQAGEFFGAFHQIGHGEITSVCVLRGMAGSHGLPASAAVWRAGFKIETLHSSVAGFAGFAGYLPGRDKYRYPAGPG